MPLRTASYTVCPTGEYEGSHYRVRHGSTLLHYLTTLTLRVWFGFLLQRVAAYRFLKQARHRASRLFMKEGDRSSLLQYRQTSFAAFGFEWEVRAARCLAFLAFGVTTLFPLVMLTALFADADLLLGTRAASPDVAFMVSFSDLAVVRLGFIFA